MKNHIAISYLCYINEKNFERRHKNFNKSLESMSFLSEQKNCTVYAIDNDCTEKVINRIQNQKGIDSFIKMHNNFFDICAVYSSAKIAKIKNFKYCCYMFDDFVVYNNNFVDDCIDFLNQNEDVGCIRIPAYSFDNMNKYDSNKTPKSLNPDAVRHYSNNHVEKKPLEWEGPFDYKSNRFYKNNWHYSSRPAIWRTGLLYSFFEEQIPVMQKFELLAAKKFYKSELKTGVLDGGAMYTFLESERMTGSGNQKFENVLIKKSDIDKVLEREVSQ
jgi:hypothetical protein